MSHIPLRDTGTGTHTSIVLPSPPICLPVYEEVEAQNVQLYDEEQGRPTTTIPNPSAHGSDDGMRVSYPFPSSVDSIPEPFPRTYSRIPPPPPPPPLAIPFPAEPHYPRAYPPVRADPLPRLQTLAELQNEIHPPPHPPPPPPPPTACTRVTQVVSWVSMVLGLTVWGYYIFRNS
jgi:hypothetical protein